VNFFKKLRRRLSPSADPEAVAEQHRSQAEQETIRDRQRALSGPRGVPGLAPPKRDVNDPR